MNRPREWVFLSDLHLSDGPGARGADEALPRFLTEVVATSAPGPRTLVLLGDTFDLNGPDRLPDELVAARVTRLAEAHADFFATLALCIRSGVHLSVVGGNHDIELTRPAVADAFVDGLGVDRDDPRVCFSPWMVCEPGVFYAEHGNQHHELNRIPMILATPQLPDGRALPVTPLGSLSTGYSWCPGNGARSRRVARSVVATLRHERLVDSVWYRSLIEQEASHQRVSAPLLTELARVSQFTVAASVVGISRRVAERRWGLDRQGGYLAPKAELIHRALSAAGQPAAAYVFGHSHRAEKLPLKGEPAAAYLNSGTWSDNVRGAGPDRDDRRWFPYVTVTADDAGVRAEARFWNSGCPD